MPVLTLELRDNSVALEYRSRHPPFKCGLLGKKNRDSIFRNLNRVGFLQIR